MKGFLIDVQNDKAVEVQIDGENHLKQFYSLIGCRCIDIIMRTIGGKYYNIVLDDEGLLVDNPVFAAIDGQLNAMLAGNLVIFGVGNDMDLVDLDDADIRNIRDNTYEVIDFDTLTMHPVVVMEY